MTDDSDIHAKQIEPLLAAVPKQGYSRNTIADHSAARRNRLMRYQLEALARQAVRVPVPVLLAAAVVAATVAGHTPWAVIALWVAGICVALLARWLYSRHAKNDPRGNPAHALRVMTGLSLVNGLITGLAAILFLPNLPTERQAILTMIMVCWSAGAVSANAAYGRAFFAYAIPMLMPLALTWVHSGAAGGAWIALLIILFLVIQAGFVRDNERVFRRSLVIQYRNERLVEKLREERRAVTHERDRAEEANRAKSRFLYSASHDLRQPLSAILINSSVLSKTATDDRFREVALDIKQGARSLNTLLDSLLNISKLDAGAVQPEPGRVSLDPMLYRLAAEFRPVALSKGLSLEVQCPARIFVHTDELWIEDILRNLVDNAIKYTDAGGVILRGQITGQQASVQIVDTGIGIPEEEHSRIYEELYQVHRDRSRGHGLGLAIVRRRVRELGIRLSLESRPGIGSTFSLTLNVSDEPATSVEQFESSAVAEDFRFPQRIRVLLVDDDQAFLRSLHTLLEGWSCDVLLACDFDSAMAQLADENVDIILTDYRLPGNKNGIDLVRTARALHHDVPAMLLSGDTAPDPPLAARALGIGFLTKPASEEDIRRHMALAISSSARGG